MKKKIALTLFLGFFKSNKKVNALFDKQVLWFKEKYSFSFSLARICITGINRVRIEQFALTYHKHGVSVKDISIGFNFLGLLKGRSLLSCMDIVVQSPRRQLPEPDKTGPSPEKDGAAGKDYFPQLDKLYARISQWLFSGPLHITITDISFNRDELVNIALLKICSSEISAVLNIRSETVSFSGRILSESKEISLSNPKGFAGNPSIRTGPMAFHFKESRTSDRPGHHFLLELAIHDVVLHHRLISRTLCRFKDITLSLPVSVDKTAIGCYDSSFIIDGCPISFWVFSSKNTWPGVGSLWVIKLDKTILEKIMSHFRNHLVRLDDTALFVIRVVFKFNLHNPQQQFFDIGINKEGFEADNVVFDLGYIKEPFNHTIYPEKGEMRKVVFPASESAGYIPLSCLRPLLPQLIVFNEDFHFPLHAGVDSYFIGRAIVINIKKRKIVRGASTITMQLCKNLFLTQETSVIRKLEEMAISLIMERIFSISKDRILELYLNVIEFGPMVYGIKEASYFYFDKHPNDLSVTEALVMTYIIPRPIHFYDALMTRSQRLIINLGNFIDELMPRLINNRMGLSLENIDKKIVFSQRFGVLELSQ